MPEFSDLTISAEKVCFVVAKARQFDAKDVLTDPGDDSNPTDDGGRAILEDHADDPVRQELAQFIAGLNIDEQIDLVALAWLGRGDGDLDGWVDLRTAASDAHNTRTARYLIGTPLLADYLEEALAAFGESCEGYDA
jgi:hypothetical protein